MNTTAQEIGAAIFEAMQRNRTLGKPMSGAELARLSGVPQPTISRTLKGKSIPETETLAKIIAALGANNVVLPKEIMAMLPAIEKPITLAPMTVACFSLPCSNCGQASLKSFIELEANDEIRCASCGSMIEVAQHYPESVLKTFLESIGCDNISLRKRNKAG